MTPSTLLARVLARLTDAPLDRIIVCGPGQRLNFSHYLRVLDARMGEALKPPTSE